MRYRMVLDTCDTVIHEKVAYPNRYGITIAADMFLPKDIDKSKKYAAIIFGTPYGGVKEQGAGIYAQTMAEGTLYYPGGETYRFVRPVGLDSV